MNKTILVPSMLPIHFQLLTPVFKDYGYNLVVLDNYGDNVKEEGLAHVHNDTCYPALLVIGQFIDALKSGKYDLNNVALLITQTAGGCRASNYLSLLRKALKKEGWDFIPCLSLNFSGLEKNNTLKLPISLLIKIGYGAIYCDAIMWLKNQVLPYEKIKNSTDLVIDELINDLASTFKKNKFFKATNIFQMIINKMASIETTCRNKVKVGIVGEIYMKYSPLGNQHLEDFLINEGFEPVVSGVMDFVLYCLENSNIDSKYYHKHYFTHHITNLVKKYLIKIQNIFISELNNIDKFDSPSNFNEVINNGENFIDKGIKMGEGWLLTSEIITLIKEGTYNVISAQPFGCLPNHIVARGMMKKIKETYNQANIVAIDYDPSASSVNQENRIKLMLANAKLNNKYKKSTV